MKAYFVIANWPDGTEGLIFPRPGNVEIANTEKQGLEDFEKALRDLEELISEPGIHSERKKKFLGTTLCLMEFERKNIILKSTLR